MGKRFTEAERAEIWDRLASGESGSTVATAFGRFPSAIHAVQRVTGGVRPAQPRRRKNALTLAEREEISRGLASKETYRSIALRLRRAPSTVCREVQRNAGRPRGVSWQTVHSWLSSRPAADAELREQYGYTASYPAFIRHLRGLRAPLIKDPQIRFETGLGRQLRLTRYK